LPTPKKLWPADTAAWFTTGKVVLNCPRLRYQFDGSFRFK
jgi:hypothetical protein